MKSRDVFSVLKILFTVIFAISLSGCLPTIGNEENDSLGCGGACLAEKVISCEDMEPGDLAYIGQLEADAVSPSGAAPYAEFDEDATFNKVEELARIGCSRSVPVLATEAERIWGDRDLDVGGMFELEIDGPRKLLAIVHAFQNMLAINSQSYSFLKKISDEPRPIIDGHNGYSLHTASTETLAMIKNKKSEAATAAFKSYHYDWNPGLNACSTSYLQPDGSRLGFIADWTAYAAAVSAMSTTDPVLADMVREPRYCDGQDGFQIQKTALNRMGFASRLAETEFLVATLKLDDRRGNALNRALAQRMAYQPHATELPDEDIDAKILELLGSASPHADEYVRTMAIQSLQDRCLNTQRSMSFCKGEIKSTVEHHFKKDLYITVRWAALEAIRAVKEAQN